MRTLSQSGLFALALRGPPATFSFFSSFVFLSPISIPVLSDLCIVSALCNIDRYFSPFAFAEYLSYFLGASYQGLSVRAVVNPLVLFSSLQLLLSCLFLSRNQAENASAFTVLPFFSFRLLFLLLMARVFVCASRLRKFFFSSPFSSLPQHARRHALLFLTSSLLQLSYGRLA